MGKKGWKQTILAGIAALSMAAGMAAGNPWAAQAVYAQEGLLPAETNTSFAKARELEFGISMSCNVTESDKDRYYKFSLEQASHFQLGVDRKIGGFGLLYVRIYDDSMTEVYKRESYDRSYSLQNVYLTGGNYYLLVGCSEADSSTITFVAETDAMNESFTETQDANNDMMSNANTISFKEKYKGVLGQNDDIDYFKFQVPAAGTITLNLTNAIDRNVRYVFYDESANPAYQGNVQRESKVLQPVSVKAGLYYLAIAKADVNEGSGSYTFIIDYTKKDTAAPQLKSVKNPAGGTMAVKWSGVTGAGGYELWYTTRPNFKGDVVKNELGASETKAYYYGLTQKKKYYVKIRAYTVVNGVKEYGKWSGKKSVVIKR